MNHRNRTFATLLVIAASFTLASCAAKPPEDVQIKGSIEAVATVNPDSVSAFQVPFVFVNKLKIIRQ